LINKEILVSKGIEGIRDGIDISRQREQLKPKNGTEDEERVLKSRYFYGKQCKNQIL
jgi:hypothetical protein